jgi:DNA polymerase
MTGADKQKIANFLDITDNFLGCGYRNIRENQFDDDKFVKNDISDCEQGVLEQIASEIRACRNCRLAEKRKNAAPGEGVERPLVMVIGEGPGQEEDAQGRPFVGAAGKLLDKMLEAINLSRNTNCFIANVVKCRPPNNRDPAPEETAACAHFLERQSTYLNTKFTLAAGKVAANTLLKTTESVGKLRSKFHELNVNNTVYPFLVTYHPSALLRSEDLKRPAWEDLKLLRSKIEETNGDT